MSGIFEKNAADELTEEGLVHYGAQVIAEAKARTAAALTNIRAACSQANSKMVQDACSRYMFYSQLAAGQVRAGLASAPEAIERAVMDMSAEGITFSEYIRADGVKVRVPVDVGVRRTIRTHTAQSLEEQTLNIATLTGQNLIEVSSHIGARPSHARWQGRIYQLNGSSAQYPNYYEATHAVSGPYADWVDGLGGYNCYHSIRIYHEGEKPRYSPNPEAGTGYTNDEVYALRQRERALENDERKLKRQREVARSQGWDTLSLDSRIRDKQKELRALVNANPKVLGRESWREQVVGGVTAGTRKSPSRIMLADIEHNAAYEAWHARASDKTKNHLNRQQYENHHYLSKEWLAKIERTSGNFIPGALTISETEAQQIVDEYCGTGKPILDSKGNWTGKENVTLDRIIGYVFAVTDEAVARKPTRKVRIVYNDRSHGFVHLVPVGE